MTRKKFRYVAGSYLVALFFVWLGVTLLDGNGGAEATASGALADVPEGVQVVEIIEKEWQLIPNNLVLEPGEVWFVLKNEGTKIHDFQVSRENFDKKSKRVGVGKSRTFKLTLEAGEYVFFCPISGHRGKGMEGALVVQESR